ncbi:MAG: hypothetical protein GF344_05440 [Chitinivibrionales bacterium]|nr:hypothetical protein [Chitinivibrionales bacterium]
MLQSAKAEREGLDVIPQTGRRCISSVIIGDETQRIRQVVAVGPELWLILKVAITIPSQQKFLGIQA